MHFIFSIIISIILIIILHNLYIYLYTNLTPSITKDYVEKPMNKYKEINKLINEKNIDDTNIDNINNNDDNQYMETELQKYMKNIENIPEQPLMTYENPDENLYDKY